MQRYLTVGTNNISKDLFLPIEDIKSEKKNSTGNIIKPSGGLWMTKFHEVYPHYNEWVDYILVHTHLLFYKNNDRNPFVQPCSVVKLNDGAKIFVLDSREKLNYLKAKYPHPISFFSYEKLSKDYDGIFVKYDEFYTFDKMKCELENPFISYGVNTLILFNANVIEYYQPATLNIIDTMFNYDGSLSDARYEIHVSPERKVVTPYFNQSFLYAIDLLCQNILRYLLESGDYYPSLDYYELFKIVSGIIKNKFSGEFETIVNGAHIKPHMLSRILTKKIKETP